MLLRDKTMKRSSAILMPIFSLPSKYGIGTLGKEAYRFIDFLSDAKQSYWQILPVGPTSYGDSPYQSFSTFAGNPYFIDLDLLIKDGLLKRREVESINWGSREDKIDYSLIYENRFAVLYQAYRRGFERDREALTAFKRSNRWLADYALFMALKRYFGMKSWIEWEDEEIRLRKPQAVKKYQRLLKDDINFFTYLQFLFFTQWNRLKAYAAEKHIGIIGDVPIYVAMDSADVWANPKNFQLDEKNVPLEVAGVPPDYFTADGQLWGNPLYDWDYMKADGYRWWLARIKGLSRLYDVVRIDHFRGFESYWAVPYGNTTARIGRWVKGPDMDFVGVMLKKFPKITFIAEDLGYHTPQVEALLQHSGLPGMKVLQFAFDAREPSDHAPHTYGENCVCLTGAHDNSTVMGWMKNADKADIALAGEYLALTKEEGFNWGMIRGGMSSVAVLFVAQLEDYLALGDEARINIPGTASGNWQWRLTKGKLNKRLSQKIAKLTMMYGRSAD